MLLSDTFKGNYWKHARGWVFTDYTLRNMEDGRTKRFMERFHCYAPVIGD